MTPQDTAILDLAGLARYPLLLYVPHVPKIQPTPVDRLIPTAEAASILGLHVATVVRRVQAGAIPFAFKLPGETGGYLFDRAEVERLAGEKSS